MSETENTFFAWVRVEENELEEFARHLFQLQAEKKSIRFIVGVNSSHETYGRVFRDDEVDSGLIVNHVAAGNEDGTGPRTITARNSQFTADEIRGKNSLGAIAGTLVPLNPPNPEDKGRKK